MCFILNDERAKASRHWVAAAKKIEQKMLWFALFTTLPFPYQHKCCYMKVVSILFPVCLSCALPTVQKAQLFPKCYNNPPEKWTGTNSVQLSLRISLVSLHGPIEPLSSMTSPLFFGHQQLQGSKTTLQCWICKDIISQLMTISHSPQFEGIHCG